VFGARIATAGMNLFGLAGDAFDLRLRVRDMRTVRTLAASIAGFT
jgi:hypothetical protein